MIELIVIGLIVAALLSRRYCKWCGQPHNRLFARYCGAERCRREREAAR
jgi:hypothetical protein